MKRLVLAVLFAAVLAGGYYFRDSLFGAASSGILSQPLQYVRGLFGATEKQTARPAPAQRVVADVASESAAPVEVTAIGTVQPIAMVQVKSRMDGEITSVNFEEGQEVKEGDTLFTLDDRAVKAQLQQAQANLERDRAQLDRAKIELTRQSELATRGVASTQKLEDTRTAMAVAEAAVRASEATLENARVNLNYTTIRAPIDGRTGAASFKRGSIVKAVDTAPTVAPLVTVTLMKPIYVGFTVPERHLADLRAAMAAGALPVAVTVPAQPKDMITGTLTFIDSQVDVTTGTISLKAKFANDDERLWPGQFVNITLTLGVQQNAIVVPSVAIQVGPNGPYVFVIRQDSTVELRLVKPDRSVGDKTVIAEGIKAGERVVVDGQLRLGNGARVNAEQPKGAQPKSAAPKGEPTPVAERTP